MFQVNSSSTNGHRVHTNGAMAPQSNYIDAENPSLIHLHEVAKEATEPQSTLGISEPAVTAGPAASSSTWLERLGLPFNGMAIWKKIALCLGTAYLGLVSMFLLGSFSNSELGAGIRDLGESQIPAVRAQMEADMMHDGLRAVVLRALVSSEVDDKDSLNESVEEVTEFSKNFSDAFDQLEAARLPEVVDAQVKEIRPIYSQYASEAARLVSLAAKGKRQEALSAIPEFQRLFKQLEGGMEELGDTIQNGATENSRSYEKLTHTIQRETSVVFFLVLVSSALIAWVISANITKPIGLAVRALEGSDISALRGIKNRDEIGRIAVAVNSTLEKIHADAQRMQEVAKQAHELEVEKNRQELAREAQLTALENKRNLERAEAEKAAAAARQAQIEAESRRQADAANAERIKSQELQRKVDQILTIVDAASNGDLKQQVTVSGDDAIGQVGNSLKRFLGNLRQNVAQIAKNAGNLASSSEGLAAVSTQLESNSHETSHQTAVVASASEEICSNVQTVATGTEQMTASIKEIAVNANEAAKIAAKAVVAAHTTNDIISKLGDSSAEIGKVIKVITSIAEQTNLLALNATIEAARAGEAGKGFAVVANEVKELAKETARATEEIGHKISTIQADTSEAVSAIGEICDVINRVNDISTSIASAVEEQTATTNEMARNIAEVARGSTDITKSIAGVSRAAQSTSDGAIDSKNASQELAEMASSLKKLVAQFQY